MLHHRKGFQWSEFHHNIKNPGCLCLFVQLISLKKDYKYHYNYSQTPLYDFNITL